jgi:hypothetical protein
MARLGFGDTDLKQAGIFRSSSNFLCRWLCQGKDRILALFIAVIAMQSKKTM